MSGSIVLVALPGSTPIQPHHAKAICALSVEGKPSSIKGPGFVIDGCTVRHDRSRTRISGWFTDLEPPVE